MPTMLMDTFVSIIDEKNVKITKIASDPEVCVFFEKFFNDEKNPTYYYMCKGC